MRGLQKAGFSDNPQSLPDFPELSDSARLQILSTWATIPSLENTPSVTMILNRASAVNPSEECCCGLSDNPRVKN